MTAPPPTAELFTALSREPLLMVDAASTITWADDRARRTLGPGAQRLRDAAVPGTEDKVDRLVADTAAILSKAQLSREVAIGRLVRRGRGGRPVSGRRGRGARACVR